MLLSHARDDEIVSRNDEYSYVHYVVHLNTLYWIAHFVLDLITITAIISTFLHSSESICNDRDC